MGYAVSLKNPHERGGRAPHKAKGAERLWSFQAGCFAEYTPHFSPPDCDKRVSKWCLFVGACARCCFGIASRGDPSPPGGDLPPLKPRHFVWWGFLVSGRRGCYPCSVGLADLTGTHTPHQCTARAYPPVSAGDFCSGAEPHHQGNAPAKDQDQPRHGWNA